MLLNIDWTFPEALASLSFMCREALTRCRRLAVFRWMLPFALLAWIDDPALGGGQLRVIETDPPSPSTLGHWEQFHVHLEYETDQAIRIYVEAFNGNARVPSFTSASPLYPVRKGEADVWVAYDKPAHVDRIVARSEAPGTRVAQIDIPVKLTWTGTKPMSPRQPAPWVERLRDEGTRRLNSEFQAQRNRPEASWENALVYLMMWAGPIYLILQIMLLLRYRNGWRYAAMVPVVPMVGVLIYTMYAFQAGSNIFPIVLIFVSPFALLYLLALMATHKAALRTP